MALSSGSAIKGATTSRLLNKLAHDVANKASDITTATTSDVILMADASADYEVKYADSVNVLEMIGSAALSSGLSWTYSSDSTHASNSVESLAVNTTMTGAGGVGGRARFELDTNVALGGWANALKAQTQFGASGSVTGLGSAMVAEMILSAGTSSGTYAGVEIEMGMPSGASTGTATSFLYLSAYGDDVGTFDDNGFLFHLAGVTAGAAHLFASNAKTGIGMTHTLRVNVAGTTYYLPLHTSANFGGS